MKIDAFAAFGPKEALRPFAYTAPELGPHEILVQVSHCGLCRSDLHLIDDDWKRSRYPLVPGHEIIGSIAQKGTLAELPLGQRIGVSWIRSSCLNCPQCRQGDTNVCQNKTTTCNGFHGGFANYMIADSRFVYPIPDSLDSAHAAPLLCAGATVYAPLRKHNANSSHSVAVIGIGGLGHLALQFSSALGCETTALSRTASKKLEAQSFGARHFHTLDSLPAPFQFDLILSTVDANLDWNAILSLLKPKGTLVFLGRPLSPAQIDIAQILSTQRTITGNSTTNRPLLNDMLQFASRHAIRPKIELFPLSNANLGIERLKSNSVRYRVVLEI